MKRIVVVLAAIVILAATASAESVIGFYGTGGVLTWSGSTTALKGVQLGISATMGLGTPANEGLHLVSGGKLYFSTGSFAGTTIAQNGDSVLTFNPGGSFNLYGSVPDAGILQSVNLLSGNFTGITTFDPVLGLFAATTGTAILSANPSLLAFYGTPAGSVPLEFTAQVVSGLPRSSTSSPFTTPVYLTHLNNSQLSNSPVPEPASIVLLSLVLLGCSTVVRHRLNRQS